MAVIEMRGDPEIGIPPNSYCRLVSLPEQHTIWEGHASDSVAMDLPIAWVSLTVVKPSRRTNHVVTYSVEYLHGISIEQVKEIERIDPDFVRTNAKNGLYSYSCTAPGCDVVLRTMTAMKVHVALHFGINIIENPNMIHKLVNQMERLAPRLSGSMPQPGSMSVPVPSPGAAVHSSTLRLKKANVVTDVVQEPKTQPVVAQPKPPSVPLVKNPVKAG